MDKQIETNQNEETFELFDFLEGQERIDAEEEVKADLEKMRKHPNYRPIS